MTGLPCRRTRFAGPSEFPLARPDDHQAILLHRLGLTLPEYVPATDEKTNGV